MLGVDVRHLGTCQVTDDDTVAMAVQEGLPLGILVHDYRLAPLSPRHAGEGEPVGDSLSGRHLPVH